MTKIYLGNDITEYTFNSNVSIKLSSEDVEELVSLSDNYQILSNKNDELSSYLGGAKREILDLERKNEKLEDDLVELQDNHKKEVDKRINEAQVMISALRLTLDTFVGGTDALKKLEDNNYIIPLEKKAS